MVSGPNSPKLCNSRNNRINERIIQYRGFTVKSNENRKEKVDISGSKPPLVSSKRELVREDINTRQCLRKARKIISDSTP